MTEEKQTTTDRMEMLSSLHLFLGADVKVVNDEYTNGGYTGKMIGVDGIGYNGRVLVLHPLGSDGWELAHNVTPILRPLTDMTEDECYEFAVATHEVNGTFNRQSAISAGVTLMKDIIKGGKYANIFPKQFQYLLSKHFDVFGWIEKEICLSKLQPNKS